MLSFLGLPSTLANGTNRVGVLMQSIIGFRTYQKKANIQITGRWGTIIAIVLGSIVGTQMAVEINEQYLNWCIAILMVFLLGLVLFKPKQWLKEHNSQAQWSKIVRYIAFFFIGIYGGFIQAGVGIFLLSAFIIGEGLNLKQANGIKLLVVLLYTIPSLLLFVYNNQVEWLYGILLGCGQIVGAWLAAIMATSYPNANVYIRYLLIIILLASIIRFSGLAMGMF